MPNDTTDELRAAAESIDAARERAPDDAADRLDGFAERVRKMADGERGPDHGALARLEHGLQDVRTDLDDEGAEAVDEALDHVRAYRSTVDGV
ncbi:DUF7553 family protein [Halorussus litoreus]|uniref:DUF7553 family protein n=1 Tax=Halorussus litoreus TaxID=1710536 RepID=UPI000E23F306|nr:hypothetical protein [Halorussus litoreus]